jgi:hypothetical protein
MQNSPTEQYIDLILKKQSSENYLRFIFNTPSGSTIQVNRDHEVGQYLFSRIRTCSFKKRRLDSATGIIAKLQMPTHGNDCGRNCLSYYSAEDMVRINDYIEASAYLDFRMMVQTGNIDLKMDRKTVIEIYSDLIFGEDKYEMLKKDEYRKRKKIREYLQTAAKAFNYR